MFFRAANLNSVLLITLSNVSKHTLSSNSENILNKYPKSNYSYILEINAICYCLNNKSV